MRSGTWGACSATGAFRRLWPTSIASFPVDSQPRCAVSSPVLLGGAGTGATTEAPLGSHIGAAACATRGMHSSATTLQSRAQHRCHEVRCWKPSRDAAEAMNNAGGV
jgi:hypothetical protein